VATGGQPAAKRASESERNAEGGYDPHMDRGQTSDDAQSSSVATTLGTLAEAGAHLLAAAGVPDAPARRTGWALAAADAWGLHSHGMLRLPYYLRRLAAGGLDPRAELRQVGGSGSFIGLDGGAGLGHWQAWAAAEQAAALASDFGIGAVAVANSSHLGALGLYVLPATRRGQLGLAFSNGPAAIPPVGGHRPVLSTSPIAAGMDLGPGARVLCDVSVAAVARGKLAAAAAAGQPIPSGWALGPDGEPTTDPQTALAGMIAPVGGQKGYALGVLFELLTGVLVGPSLACAIADPLDDHQADRPQGVSHLLVALDPSALGDPTGVAERLAGLDQAVADAGGRLPGSRRLEPDALADSAAVTIAPTTAEDLLREARRLGVALPPELEEPVRT